MTKVGFVGVGIMGRPMAGRLQDGGHELFLLRHRSPLPGDLVEKGAHVCRSGREVAEGSEIVFAMVPDTPDVEEALFAPNGVTEGLEPGKAFVDMSSTSPVATQDFARRVGALGADYLDAPVSGGEEGARQGTLTIMVGGPEPAFERVKPLFTLMGRTITRVGDSGHGQIAKVANQIIVALTIEAVAEALLFAARAGADVEKVRRALMGGFASSRILELHGVRMIARNFVPGGRLTLHRKDLKHALEAARALELSLPNTAICEQLFNACAALGLEDADHASLVRALEALAGFELGGRGDAGPK